MTTIKRQMDGQTQQERQRKRARPPVYEERIQDSMHVMTTGVSIESWALTAR